MFAVQSIYCASSMSSECLCAKVWLQSMTCSRAHYGGHFLQVYAAVEDKRSGSRMVVFDVHIGESQASWERQKIIPDSVNDACTLSSRSTMDMQQSKAGDTWQVTV